MEKKVDAKILQKQMDLQEASFRPSKARRMLSWSIRLVDRFSCT
jgi:hypothetical protein